MTAAAPRAGARPRAVFFGSPAFAVPCLRAVAAETELVAVVSQPDRPAGRGQAPAAPAVKRAAEALGLPGLPILQPEKIRTPETHAALAALDADLFVVVAYGRILPQSLLDLPRLGPFNVHASLLPKLRGAAPIQWSIIRGERETGVSIMRMEAGLDTGPVAAVQALDIADDDTTGTLSVKLAELGAKLLVDTLTEIVKGTITLRRQDDAAATLAPLLAKVDGIVNFDQPARLVSAQARGVDPWPGATTTLGGESLKLFAPRVVEAASVDVTRGQQPPGLIRDVTADGLLVCCADDEQLIAFAEIQFPGKRRMPALVARDRLPTGTRLGS
jgi:methionyl-tRNA formyltransferase